VLCLIEQLVFLVLVFLVLVFLALVFLVLVVLVVERSEPPLCFVSSRGGGSCTCCSCG
jgi:lipopolysaccharide/colanic/teichoic acid biosynthesis glycosyltransferase